MEDEQLKRTIDYSEGQKEAAYSVLGEIVNLLGEYAEDMRVIGGWVPSLLYPDSEHIGSIDVDILLNQQHITTPTRYMTIRRILEKNGYRPRLGQFFTYVKTVSIQGVDYDVDVDFLAGMYGGVGKNVSKHVDGIKALQATGGNFAFEFPADHVKIAYTRPDGAKDYSHINVISTVPYLVMKTAALGRGKPKDAYDIYWMLRKYPGGVRRLAEAFTPYRGRKLIQDMCCKLEEKFASPEHAGPVDIVSFLDIRDEEERAQTAQDAYQRVQYLVRSLNGHEDERK